MRALGTALCLVGLFIYGDCDNWQEWWTYDGISGPAYWGLMNPQWNMCSRGRRQSPVNVEPDKLLYDPYLRHIHIDKHKVSGTLHNTGQSLVFRVDKDTKQHVNISGGPLAYRYQFEEIYIHYGTDNQQGSEHHIQGYSFPAEIQFYGFNKELYHNMSEAQHKSQGIVAISLMVQIGDTPNGELRLITTVFNKVQYKGAFTPVKHISLRDMLPKTDYFMTYEGSTTHPGCWETTVWIIYNKPIYITKHELYQLRKLMQGSEEAPKAPLGNNARPIQPLHQRTIRTNINFKNAEVTISSCLTVKERQRYEHCLMTSGDLSDYDPSATLIAFQSNSILQLSKPNINSCPSMHKEMYYRANKWSQNIKDYNPFHSLHSLQ